MFRTIRRAIHTNVNEEWTKASLRRMKKPDLVRLAKEHNLKLSGTKNDIIIQLLTHQTAKIVGVETPSSLSLPKTKEPPAFGSLDKDSYVSDEAWTNAFEMKLMHRGSSNNTQSSGSKPHHFNQQVKPSLLLKSEDFFVSEKVPAKELKVTEDLEGMDPQWVEAFDLKVGSRGGRRDLTDTLSTTITTSLPVLEDLEFITLEKGLGKKFDHVKKHTEKHGKVHYHNSEKHAISKEKSEPVDKSEPEQKSEFVEESEPVKKNESSKLVEKSEPVQKSESVEKSKPVESSKPERNSNPVKKSEPGKKSKTSEHTSDTKADGSRETMINSAIGSSMILWYLGGEEGLLKIWQFFT